MVDTNSAHRSRIESIVETHPAATFFVVTLAVSWGLWGLAVAVSASVTRLSIIPGGFGPAIAAITIMWLRGESVRAWLRAGLSPSVQPRWYAVALGLPIALGLGMAALLVVGGGTLATSQLLGVLPMYPLFLAVTMLVGGGQEEFGWRGLALPALQGRFDALTASVLVGVGWAVWHLPLFAFDAPGYAGRSVTLYVLLVIGFSVILTWLYNNTGGSILLAMILHGGINAASSLGGAAVSNPAIGAIPIYGAYAIPVWITVFGLLVWFGYDTLSADEAVTTLAGRTPEEMAETASDASV